MKPLPALAPSHRAFLLRCRVGHLATADRHGVPHLVPVCFAIGAGTIYTPIDEKPKNGRELKRLANIGENARASFLADRYEDDWTQLGWLRIDGSAEVLSAGAEYEEAIRLLAERYPQYAAMRLSRVIALRIRRIGSWGKLDA